VCVFAAHMWGWMAPKAIPTWSFWLFTTAYFTRIYLYIGEYTDGVFVRLRDLIKKWWPFFLGSHLPVSLPYSSVARLRKTNALERCASVRKVCRSPVHVYSPILLAAAWKTSLSIFSFLENPRHARLYGHITPVPRYAARRHATVTPESVHRVNG